MLFLKRATPVPTRPRKNLQGLPVVGLPVVGAMSRAESSRRRCPAHPRWGLLCIGVFLLGACDRPPSPGGFLPPSDSVTIPGTHDALSDDAAADGWQSEVLSAQAQRALGDQIAGHELPLEHPGFSVAEDAEISRLRPLDATESFAGPDFRVLRNTVVDAGDPDSGSKTDRPPFGRGRTGWETAVGELRSVFAPESLHVKVKVFGVETESGATKISAYVQVWGAAADDGAPRQINATWETRWSGPQETPVGAAEPGSTEPGLEEAGGALRLLGVRLRRYEEIESTRGRTEPLFGDATLAVLSKDPVFDTQLRHGVDHWTARIEMRHGLDVGGWQGLSIGDVNGDGLDDIYVCQPGGLPNRLFLQRPDGSGQDISAAAGVDWLESTHGALIVDLDNDGHQDLLVGVADGVLVHAGDGKGTFAVKAARVIPAAMPYSFAAADYDQDGDLDIYLCCYDRRKGVNRHLVFARPVPYHDANNGGRNVLLRNDGGWRFSHVTRRVGLDVNNRRFSYAAAWEDFDDDGDLDLYVANDFGRNNLYRNDGGHFVDVAPEAGVEDISPGMSACWGDYDGDGRPDLYVSNMFSSAGNRITFQEKFLSGTSDVERSELQRHARGNSLFRNLGNGKFADVSVDAGVSIGRWAWGSRFVDLQNDGLLDLVVSNGFITQEDKADL